MRRKEKHESRVWRGVRFDRCTGFPKPVHPSPESQEFRRQCQHFKHFLLEESQGLRDPRIGAPGRELRAAAFSSERMALTELRASLPRTAA